VIRIITVGTVKKKEVGSLIDYYMKQMKRVSVESVLSKEKLLERVKEGEFVVACSEDGKEMDSVVFSSLLEKHFDRHIVFLIGDAFGLDASIKEKADMVLSLSQLTMPHEMALLVLIEQVYRGLSISKGKQYHK
jgi:23S rRNA (pseudouridine1915-N3)-methyltransferase